MHRTRDNFHPARAAFQVRSFATRVAVSLPQLAFAANAAIVDTFHAVWLHDNLFVCIFRCCISLFDYPTHTATVQKPHAALTANRVLFSPFSLRYEAHHSARISDAALVAAAFTLHLTLYRCTPH